MKKGSRSERQSTSPSPGASAVPQGWCAWLVHIFSPLTSRTSPCQTDALTPAERAPPPVPSTSYTAPTGSRTSHSQESQHAPTRPQTIRPDTSHLSSHLTRTNSECRSIHTRGISTPTRLLLEVGYASHTLTHRLSNVSHRAEARWPVSQLRYHGRTQRRSRRLERAGAPASTLEHLACRCQEPSS